jgi:hypothetical protein
MVAVGEACGRNVEDRGDGERCGQGGRGSRDKNVSNIRSIKKRTSASHHRVGAKKEDERERKSNGVRWLLCGLMFERASFRPISSHEKGPGEKETRCEYAIMRGMDPETGG